jgi:putative transcriptional regulator
MNTMKKEVFDELLESVRQGGEILRGKRRPSRRFEIAEPDARAVRKQHGLSQDQFAGLMGISVGTLRNWEQGRGESSEARRACCWLWRPGTPRPCSEP